MKSCFICPIYDKNNDFKFALDFYYSKLKNNINTDICFVFSDELQKNKFKGMLEGETPNIIFLVVPEGYARYKNPIVAKKFYAIETLYTKYEFVAAVDCESLFIKNVNIDIVLNEIWKSGTMLSSNISSVGYDIMSKCANFLGLNNNEVLLNETENFRYNMWFNEIPIYKTDTLKDFFCWMKKNNYIEIVYNEWNCFDYYVYCYYLIIEKGYKLLKNKRVTLTGAMEEINRYNLKERHRIEKEMRTHWTPNKEFYNNENIVMFFHLDRGADDEKYISADKYRYKIFVMRLKFLHPKLYNLLYKLRNLFK